MPSISRLSGQVARDNNDERASGALAYFYAGGTTTPLTTYSDAAETSPNTHPVVADAYGRWPVIFVPFTTSYDEKITTSTGTQLSYFTEIPNPDPVDIAAGAVTTSSEQILQSGDFLFQAKSGTRAGFVRANGRTIGNAGSGATERANDDCSNLFVYLWDNFADAILAVSTGRGASAAADFAASKTIALFDLRGATLRGLDDMGNTAASALTLATFTTGNATTGGSVCGVNTHIITEAQLPTVTPAGAVAGTVSYTPAGSVTGTITTNTILTAQGTGGSHVMAIRAAEATSTDTTVSTLAATFTGTAANPAISATFTGTPFGSGTAHNNVSKSVLGNWLIKL